MVLHFGVMFWASLLLYRYCIVQYFTYLFYGILRLVLLCLREKAQLNCLGKDREEEEEEEGGFSELPRLKCDFTTGELQPCQTKNYKLLQTQNATL